MLMLLVLTQVAAGQDEMIELGEREATEAVAEKEAAETAAHAALMSEANLEVRARLALSHATPSSPCYFTMQPHATSIE